jgi:ethanolamine utilization protein EutP (predicted NTPase)
MLQQENGRVIEEGDSINTLSRTDLSAGKTITTSSCKLIHASEKLAYMCWGIDNNAISELKEPVAAELCCLI